MVSPPEPKTKTLRYRFGTEYGIVVTTEAVGSAMNCRKLSNRKSVSVGPPFASGWNWTENQGLEEWMMPSLVPSFALTFARNATLNGARSRFLFQQIIQKKTFRLKQTTADHQWNPVLWQCGLINGKAMILGRDVAALGSQINHRLVHSAIAKPTRYCDCTGFAHGCWLDKALATTAIQLQVKPSSDICLDYEFDIMQTLPEYWRLPTFSKRRYLRHSMSLWIPPSLKDIYCGILWIYVRSRPPCTVQLYKRAVTTNTLSEAWLPREQS